MSFKSHFKIMAGYNHRLNGQVYKAALGLSNSVLLEDKGAFFGSIMGTLNHILVGDLIWLTRFKTHSDSYPSLCEIGDFPAPTALNDMLYPDITELYKQREQLDRILTDWVSETKEGDYGRDLTYCNMAGEQCRKNFAELVSHLFNHQTHHRGQVSVLLCQSGKDIGITDLLLDIPGTKT